MALKLLKPSSPAEKMTRTTLDTIRITPEIVDAWQNPPFQRPVRINDKVKAISEQIKHDGVLPGIITLGILSNTTYLLDGQHRIVAFRMSSLEEAYVDVRIHYFEAMGQMGKEFVTLNSPLVRLRPDDILRGLEDSQEQLRRVREKCKFIGYDMIRRNERAPILSMSLALRVWRGSQTEVPAPCTMSAQELGMTFTAEDADQMIAFLSLCFDAWGRDPEYQRLWGSLNLIICAWLYRRTVITQWSPKTPKLTRDLFCKALMTLSADTKYLDWLQGRNVGERDRSPAYDRIKAMFADRLALEMGQKPKLPAPPWAAHSGRHH